MSNPSQQHGGHVPAQPAGVRFAPPPGMGNVPPIPPAGGPPHAAGIPAAVPAGGVPGGNVAPPPPGTMGGGHGVYAPGPRTYAEWYALRSNDPYNGAYTGVYSAQRSEPDATGVGPPTPAQILAGILADDSPQVYLGLNTTWAPHRSFLIHRLVRVPRPQGRPGSQYQGQVVGQLGDVHDVGASYAALHPNSFRRLAAVHVPVIGEMAAQFAAAGDAPLLGPYTSNDAGTEPVVVRNLIFVPGPYVPLVIGNDLTPRELWVRLAGAIQADQRETACRPLLDWLRVAVTDPGAGASAVGTAVPAVIAPDPPLAAMRHQILSVDLPDRDGVQQVTHTLANTLTRAVNQFDQRTQLMQQQATAATTAATTPRVVLPAEKWPTTIASAYKICGCTDDTGLPPSYFVLARAAKGQERQTLQGLYDARVGSGDSVARVAPTCTAEIARNQMQLRQHTADRRDLVGGVTIFMFPYLTLEQRSDLDMANMSSDLLQAGSAMPSLFDIQQIKASCPIVFPTDMEEAFFSAEGFSVHLDVAHGVTHPLASGFRAFLQAARMRTIQLRQLTFDDRLTPTQFLLALHNRVHGYYTACGLLPPALPGNAQVTPAPPEFMAILDRIDNDEWIRPTIPGRYLDRPAGPPPPRRPAALAPEPSPSPSPSPARDPRPPARRDPPNPLVTELLCKRETGRYMSIAEVLRNAKGPPPVRNDGRTSCIPYHFLGGCNTDCSRHYDHEPAEDAAQLEGRKAWAKKARKEDE